MGIEGFHRGGKRHRAGINRGLGRGHYHPRMKQRNGFNFTTG
jgi:hypothetical protein